MPRVVFTPSGLGGEVPTGTTVLQAARELGVDLDSVCGGRGICGRCQVAFEPGQYSKWAIESTADALSPWGETEESYGQRRGIKSGRRLGCCALVRDDVVVDVPPESQVHRPVVRKSLDLTDVVLDPAISLSYIELPPSVLGDAESMSDLVIAALFAEFGRTVTGLSLEALQEVHRAFGGQDRAATVAVRGETVVAIWPGYVDRVYGIAVDIGSTTIAGHLVELLTGEILSTAGRMNPQIRFGEDLMSRVSYVMMNRGGDRNLTVAVREALNELFAELCDDASIALDGEATVRIDDVLEVVLVGNPIMHHIVAGIDPTPLGQAPFTLATAEALSVPASAFELIGRHAQVYLAPCIAGHVGADTAAVILSEGPHRSPTMQLLVDVGTNAEIVVGDATRQFAASSPTGPAFEGAQLSCGQRATAGAIERVRIDRDTLETRFKVIGSDLWSDEEGFAADTADLDISGICGSGIIEVIGEMYLSGIIDADGVVQGFAAQRTPRVVPNGRTFSFVVHEANGIRLCVTQNDVRAIQLAKAALRAGIDLLFQHAGITEVLDIRLAGAFGSHIDPVYALVLGLVPDCPVEHVRSVGNAAGAGAVRALLSVSARREMEAAVRNVVKVETATEHDFQNLFVAAMAFPHASAPTTHLSAVMTLPAPVSSAASGERGGRRRRRDQAVMPTELTSTEEP
ncbi:MAG TPA: ASKHA domain-containing protein [Ilumatobacteraceae bacterium]|nr:ASKHA domain-containing protein [Ilumatobacteraceae bacterium]